MNDQDRDFLSDLAYLMERHEAEFELQADDSGETSLIFIVRNFEVAAIWARCVTPANVRETMDTNG